jgi:hypothetical protein
VTDQRVNLAGFEEALIQAVAAGFTFSGTFLSQVRLVPGRHLFANWMPETDEIVKTLPQGQAFDPAREPVIGFFDSTGAGGGLAPSASGGSKHSFLTEISLRLPKPGNEVKRLSAELVGWMRETLIGARFGGFLIKGVIPQGTPGGLVRPADGMIFASSRVQFLAVPSLT